jgi:alanyl-tRNA synthetase
MGLERIAALLQGKHDNYDTDLLRSLIEASAMPPAIRTGRSNVHPPGDRRSSALDSFLIADGVLPSNEGRGYVLRRIMRRAMRHAHLLGAQDPLMYRLVPRWWRRWARPIRSWPRAGADHRDAEAGGDRFRKTLDRGLKLLDEASCRSWEGDGAAGEARSSSMTPTASRST